MMTMDSVREWARNTGQEPRYINCQWMLHDYDVWVLNPHYRGPVQRHPDDPGLWEDDYFSDGVPLSAYENFSQTYFRHGAHTFVY